MFSACLSVSVENTTFYQSAGGGIKSHSATNLVSLGLDTSGRIAARFLFEKIENAKSLVLPFLEERIIEDKENLYYSTV